MDKRVGQSHRFKHQIPRSYERVFGSPAPKGMSPTKQLEAITTTATELRAQQAEQALLAWLAE